MGLFLFSASRLPTGHEAFPAGINSYQFFKIFPFGKINKGTHWYAEFPLGWGGVAKSQTRLSDCSVQCSRSVVSNSLRPRESQHTRPPCPWPTLGVYSNSCPSSWWCHPSISSSVIPFSSCPQSLPASGSFPMSQLFAWGGQSIGVSASASVLPMNTQDWSPSGWTGRISLQSKGLSGVFSNTKHQFFGSQLSSQSRIP